MELIEPNTGFEAYLSFNYDDDSISGFKYAFYDTAEESYKFAKDACGNVIGLVNLDGAVVSYEYDAWGGNCKVYDKNGNDKTNDPNFIGNINPIRWKSQYYDTESGFYYIDGRYYSPEIKQFLSPAPPESMLANALTIYGLNSYLLCLTNPLSMGYNGYNIMSGTPLAYDPNELTDWTLFWQGPWGTAIKGIGMVVTAIGAIALSVTTFGAGIPIAMQIIASIALGAGILTGVNGVATLGEAATGYNFMRDGLFNDVLGWSDTAYDWYAGITEGIAIAGSLACEFYQSFRSIKGFTDHGLESALGHDEHGVTGKAMRDAVKNPLKTVSQSGGRMKYIGKNAVVVLNKAGKVITTYAKSHSAWRYLLFLWLGYEFLNESEFF